MTSHDEPAWLLDCCSTFGDFVGAIALEDGPVPHSAGAGSDFLGTTGLTGRPRNAFQGDGHATLLVKADVEPKGRG